LWRQEFGGAKAPEVKAKHYAEKGILEYKLAQYGKMWKKAYPDYKEEKSKITPSFLDVTACKLLMRVLDTVDPNMAQFWFGPIKECLDYFALPEYSCEVCKITKMSFWDYHLGQGWCKSCTEKQLKEGQQDE